MKNEITTTPTTERWEQTKTSSEKVEWTTTETKDFVLKTEKNSINYWIWYLKKLGYTDVVNQNNYNEYSPCDITAVSPKGTKIAFELKRRFIYSDTYGDIMCETHKYWDIRRDYPEYKPVLVNFFKDKIGFAEMREDNYYTEHHRGSKTTEFNDYRVVDKEYWCIKNKVSYINYKNLCVQR